MIEVIKSGLSSFISDILDLIFPPVCLICRRRFPEYKADKLLCSDCFSSFKRTSPPFCKICGGSLSPDSLDNICSQCQDNRDSRYERSRSAGVYEGVLKDCIHLLKYNGKVGLSSDLGKFMADNFPQERGYIDADFIVPVPLHKARYRERGFNQAELLAEELGQRVKIKVGSDILQRIRNTKSQINLGAEERKINVKEAFKVAKDKEVNGASILLVDDVFTSGHTTSECAFALLEAGALEVNIYTLARPFSA